MPKTATLEEVLALAKPAFAGGQGSPDRGRGPSNRTGIGDRPSDPAQAIARLVARS